MADERSTPPLREPRDRAPEADTAPPMPRWVKGFGLAVVGLVVLVALLHLTGVIGGGHGPGRHGSGRHSQQYRR